MDDNQFLQALSAFRPPLPRSIEYRIYFDAQTGEIINYTNDDLPGDYILVDKDTFARHRFDCRIRDGKIIPYRLPIGKLVPSQSGTPCHPDDVTIIVTPSVPSQQWSMRTYED